MKRGWTDQAHPVLTHEIRRWEEAHRRETRERRVREWGGLLLEAVALSLILLLFLFLLPLALGPMPW